MKVNAPDPSDIAYLIPHVSLVIMDESVIIHTAAVMTVLTSSKLLSKVTGISVAGGKIT